MVWTRRSGSWLALDTRKFDLIVTNQPVVRASVFRELAGGGLENQSSDRQTVIRAAEVPETGLIGYRSKRENALLGCQLNVRREVAGKTD